MFFRPTQAARTGHRPLYHSMDRFLLAASRVIVHRMLYGFGHELDYFKSNESASLPRSTFDSLTVLECGPWQSSYTTTAENELVAAVGVNCKN